MIPRKCYHDLPCSRSSLYKSIGGYQFQRHQQQPPLRRFLLVACCFVLQAFPSAHGVAAGGSTASLQYHHTYSDSFPAYEEYDYTIMDPFTVYGSPYGGFARATRSRLAALPLPLPEISDDNNDQQQQQQQQGGGDGAGDGEGQVTAGGGSPAEPLHMVTRDATGRLFACRVYNEDELEPDSLDDSMFDAPKLRSTESASDGDTGEESDTPATDDDQKTSQSKPSREDDDPPKRDREGWHRSYDKNKKEEDDRRSRVGAGAGKKQQTIAPTLKGSSAQAPTKGAGIGSVSGSSSTQKKKGEKGTSEKDKKVSIGEMSEEDRKQLAMDNLLPLVGICGQIHKGWWSYEWCFEQHVSQFHVEISPSTGEIRIEDPSRLGTFSKRTVTADLSKEPANPHAEDTPELARITDRHSNGDLCPATGEPRASYVHMKCCSPRVLERRKGLLHQNGRPIASDTAALLELEEDKDKICVYHLTVCTPLLCDDSADPGEDDKDGESSSAKAGSSSKDGGGSGKKKKELTREEKLKRSRALKKDNESVMEILDRTLSDLCLQTNTGGWWTYEVCHSAAVRQYHESVGTHTSATASYTTRLVESEHMLGNYDKEAAEAIAPHDEWRHVVNATSPDGGPGGGLPGSGSSGAAGGAATAGGKRAAAASRRAGGNGAYFELEYTGGDVCDQSDVTESAIVAGGSAGRGGLERASSVRYYCGHNFEVSVSEDSTCHYIVEVTVPDLCDHPLFKAPVYKRRVVKCLPVPREQNTWRTL